MRVLLRPLFEPVVTSYYWTGERSFTGVYTNMIFKRGSTLALPTAPLTHVRPRSTAGNHFCDWVLLVVATLVKLKVLGARRCHVKSFILQGIVLIEVEHSNLIGLYKN